MQTPALGTASALPAKPIWDRSGHNQPDGFCRRVRALTRAVGRERPAPTPVHILYPSTDGKQPPWPLHRLLSTACLKYSGRDSQGKMSLDGIEGFLGGRHWHSKPRGSFQPRERTKRPSPKKAVNLALPPLTSARFPRWRPKPPRPINSETAACQVSVPGRGLPAH